MSLNIKRVTTRQPSLQISKILRKGYIGMANMHKKQRRQDRDGLVMIAR